MGKFERTKGHSWERQVASDLREIDPSAKRNLEYQEGGTRDILLNFPLKIQCKSQKRPAFLKAIQEASQDKPENEIAVGAVKVTGKGEYAVMPWQDFLKLLKWASIQV